MTARGIERIAQAGAIGGGGALRLRRGQLPTLRAGYAFVYDLTVMLEKLPATAPRRFLQDRGGGDTGGQYGARGDNCALAPDIAQTQGTASMPKAAASLLTWLSAAKWPCGPPKPRKAPLGQLLV